MPRLAHQFSDALFAFTDLKLQPTRNVIRATQDVVIIAAAEDAERIHTAEEGSAHAA